MKFQILSLLEENEFISGEKIAEKLNVSRSAVWKNINKLKEDGYKIKSSTKKGYCLIKGQFPYNKYEILKNLKTELIAKEMFFYADIDSTNEEVKRLCGNGATSKICVVAENQTQGKGRLGRIWSSQKGEGIYFSICLVPNIALMKAPIITLVIGMAVCRAINKHLDIHTQIKWPNDIIFNDKKICGILTEINTEINKINYIICGVGVNVNITEFPEEIRHKATSLKIETGKMIDRTALICCILKEIEHYYNLFLLDGVDSFIEDYKKECINIGKQCLATFNGEKINGTVCDIDDNGNIVLKKENGERINIFSGEVTLRRKDGSYI